jgi:hypothetical protein
MIERCFLIFGGLSVAGVVGGFLLYVPVVSVLTVAVLSGGILGTFILGYWAGSAAAPNRLEGLDNQRTESTTSAPEAVPEPVVTSTKPKPPCARRKVA